MTEQRISVGDGEYSCYGIAGVGLEGITGVLDCEQDQGRTRGRTHRAAKATDTLQTLAALLGRTSGSQ